MIGGSLVRPLYVYSIQFSIGEFDSGMAKEGAVSKAAQTLSNPEVVVMQGAHAGSRHQSRGVSRTQPW